MAKYPVDRYYIDYTSLFFKLKKHACPYCGSIVKRHKEKRMASALEARQYKLTNQDGSPISHSVQFITACFRCPACGKMISFEEMKTYEKQNK